MSTENPAIEALEAEIATIKQEQEPIHEQIASLEEQLTEGQQMIARNRAAIDVLNGRVVISSNGTHRASSRRPRGEVKQAILAYVRERPGASAAQVAQAVGGSKPSITASLQKYANDGELEKVPLGGRAVGFKIAE